MVNEKRVKHMVKLAFYEAKGGSEEIQISAYHKKDYIRKHTLSSILWMTVAYLIILIFFCAGVLEINLTQMSQMQLWILAGFAAVGYLALLIIYLTKATTFYKKKHARAYRRVKRFREDLEELERMYEKEDHDGENI